MRTLVHPATKALLRLSVDGKTVAIRRGADTAPDEKRISCDSLYHAVRHADAEEWQQLNAGWHLLDAATQAVVTTPPSLKPLWHDDLQLLFTATPEGQSARKEVRLELYDLASYAASRMESAWHWDNPARAAKLTQQATPELLALWAILNADGQVCNGGFTQFFFNSYGELAEQALAGFRLFGMHPYADIFEQAYALFPQRPIPSDREQRTVLLETMTYDGEGEPPDSIKSANQPLEYFSALATANASRWDDLETQYYGLIHEKIGVRGYNAAFFLPLCTFIAANKDAFFQCPAPSAGAPSHL